MAKQRRKRSRPKASVHRVANTVDTFTTLCKPEVVLHGLPPPPPEYEVEIHHQHMDFGMAESFAVTLTPKMGYHNLRRYGLSMAVTRAVMTQNKERVVDFIGTGIRRMYKECLNEATKACLAPMPMPSLCGTSLSPLEVQRQMKQAFSQQFSQQIDAMIMGKLTGDDYTACNEDDCGEPEEDAPKKSSKKSTWTSNKW